MSDARVPVAFFAPLKNPDDSRPSGDRTMARLLLAALTRAGYRPEVASRLRSLEPAGDPARQAAIREEASREADSIASRYVSLPESERPRFVFTYHSYYKAPDWIGPVVARRLGIPYVAAESTRAGKRAGGPWALAHDAAEAALDAAALVFAVTRPDRIALERDRAPGQHIADLPPFIDTDDLPPAPPRAPTRGPARLLTVAMMRPGDKLASYRLLADALGRLDPHGWTLDVIGDGPARDEVERLFAPLAGRVTFHGRIDDRADLARRYAAADLHVWPAVNEAYGVVQLEAQAMGCPVVAGDGGGVADTMLAGQTGLLTPTGDSAAFAAAVGSLIADPAWRRRIGEAAARFIRGERGLDRAAERLKAGLKAIEGPAGVLPSPGGGG